MTQQNIGNQQEQQDTLNIRELLIHYVVRPWYWYLVSILLCTGLCTLYYFSRTPVYKVSSTLLLRSVEDNGIGNLPYSDVLSMMGMTGSRQVVDELSILNSRTIMQQAISELGLQTEYRKKKGMCWIGQYPTSDIQVVYPESFIDTTRFVVKMSLKYDGEFYYLKVKYGKRQKSKHKLATLNEPVETCCGIVSFNVRRPIEDGAKYKIRTSPIKRLAESYLNSVTASQAQKESNVIEITTNTDMPHRAIDLISKMIELYNYDAVIDKNIMATNAKNFIEERLRVVTEELESEEQNVERYKKENGITELSAEAALYLQGSTEYQKRRVEIETQQNLLDFLRQFVQDEKNKFSFIPANIGLTDPSLTTSINEYNKLLLDRMKIIRSATSDNPMLLQMDDQLQAMRQNIELSISSVERGLQIMRRDLAQQESKFAGRIGEVPTQEREYVQIKRKQEIKQSIYLFLYQKREENALTLASTVMPAKIIDRAQVAGNVVSPNRRNLFLIAFLLGLMIPVAVIYIYDLFDNKIKDRTQYEELLGGLPVLGHLLQVSDKTKLPVVIRKNENSVSAELFRLLRTNLRFMLPAEETSSVVLVTSCINGEGKTFVAINIALSMALLGKRVALVGLDIRKPMLAKYLRLPSSGALTSYLSDSTYTLDDIIVPSNIEDNLDIIPAGVIPPNPNELLQGARLDELFAELRKKYDYVFVDSAPLALVSDTFLLDRISDVTIFVSRAEYTERGVADFINRINDQQQLKNIACVLNGVKGSGRGYGYSYGYGRRYGYGGYGYGYGGYGYGYGYGESSKKKA